jgi:hypothetical protein
VGPEARSDLRRVRRGQKAGLFYLRGRDDDPRSKGKQAWLWVAFEPGLRGVPGVQDKATIHRAYPDAYVFLKEPRAKYGRKPIRTGWEGGLVSGRVRMGPGSSATSTDRTRRTSSRGMNQYVKDRAECFDDLFPLHERGNATGEHVNNWGQGVQVLPQPRGG